MGMVRVGMAQANHLTCHIWPTQVPHWACSVSPHWAPSTPPRIAPLGKWAQESSCLAALPCSGISAQALRCLLPCSGSSVQYPR